MCPLLGGSFIGDSTVLYFQGIDSGFSGGTDDMYNVYDKPWRAGAGLAEKIYRPTRSAADKDIYGDDVDKLIKTNRYVHNGCLEDYLLVWQIICPLYARTV